MANTTQNLSEIFSLSTNDFDPLTKEVRKKMEQTSFSTVYRVVALIKKLDKKIEILDPTLTIAEKNYIKKNFC